MKWLFALGEKINLFLESLSSCKHEVSLHILWGLGANDI